MVWVFQRLSLVFFSRYVRIFCTVIDLIGISCVHGGSVIRALISIDYRALGVLGEPSYPYLKVFSLCINSIWCWANNCMVLPLFLLHPCVVITSLKRSWKIGRPTFEPTENEDVRCRNCAHIHAHKFWRCRVRHYAWSSSIEYIHHMWTLPDVAAHTITST